MGEMTLAQTIRARTSTRTFTGRPVDRELIVRLIAAAITAPSAHNRQPWRFVVVGQDENRERLVRSLSGRWRADAADGSASPPPDDRAIERNAKMLLAAPALLILCVDSAAVSQQPDAHRTALEQQMAEQSVAAAAATLLLAAHAEGLSGCWLSAPLFAPEEIRQSVCLSREWQPQALVILGYPRMKPAKPARRPLSEIVLWR